MSLIAEAAIASFRSPDTDERREAALAKRLDRLDRRMARLERDVGTAVETLALFIRFVAALGRRLNQGPKLRQEIPEDVHDSRSHEEDN